MNGKDWITPTIFPKFPFQWCCVHDLHSYPVDEEGDEQIDADSKMFKQAEEEREARRARNAGTVDHVWV